MGVIVSVTLNLNRKWIVPCPQELSYDDLLKVAQIDSHILPSRKASTINFENLPAAIIHDKSIFRVLWSSTWLPNSQLPLWNGFMQIVKNASDAGVSEVLFSKYSTDASYKISTMNFVCNQSLRCKMTLVLIFDQPLYWKATEIQLSKSNNSRVKDCVLRLGGFHICMSLQGMVGYNAGK